VCYKSICVWSICGDKSSHAIHGSEKQLDVAIERDPPGTERFTVASNKSMIRKITVTSVVTQSVLKIYLRRRH
jgi:hypothetical protein